MDEAPGGTRLKQITQDIWIFDGAPISAPGVSIPIRMTVIRLSSAGLLLHSPVRYSEDLRQELERIGPIKYLLAPNIGHWMFLRGWQRALPAVSTFAAPGLADRRQVQAARVQIDREIDGETPPEWADDLDVVSVRAPMFCEVELFDRRSRTLVLADLVQNLDPDQLSPPARLIAKLVGVRKPDGQAPIYLRLLLHLGGRSVGTAARRLLSYEPERVVFAHGDWFESHATERLRRSLRWLVPSDRVEARIKHAIAGKRVVITGASSGIGRAAALAFAERGAKVVLAARRGDVLDRLAKECDALGGQTIAVTTDVTNAEAVRRLAERTGEVFGGIDVWINNAGTGVFGSYQDADIALHRRTIEVNLLGTMHGAYAALPIFLRQGRGILINNISLGGWAPTPFAAAYTASKFGLRGFTASLRQELSAYPDIHVCGVFPAVVDTPGFVHGANMSGRRLDPGPLLYQSEDVAETFVSLICNPCAEVAVGWPARAARIAYAFAPRSTERLVGATFNWLLSRARPSEKSQGTMIEAGTQGRSVDGGWLTRKKLPAAGEISKVAIAIGAATFVLAAAYRASSHRSSGRRRRPARALGSGQKRPRWEDEDDGAIEPHGRWTRRYGSWQRRR